MLLPLALLVKDSELAFREQANVWTEVAVDVFPTDCQRQSFDLIAHVAACSLPGPFRSH